MGGWRRGREGVDIHQGGGGGGGRRKGKSIKVLVNSLRCGGKKIVIMIRGGVRFNTIRKKYILLGENPNFITVVDFVMLVKTGGN